MGLEDFILEAKAIPKSEVYKEILLKTQAHLAKLDSNWSRVTWDINPPMIHVIIPNTLREITISSTFERTFCRLYRMTTKRNIYLNFNRFELKRSIIRISYKAF